MIKLIKSTKFKLVYLVLAAVFYSLAAVMTGSNIAIAISDIFVVAGILLYAEHTIAAVWMFLLSEVCSLLMMIGVGDLYNTLEYGSTELYILMIGVLIITVRAVRKLKKESKTKFKEAIKIIAKTQKRPRKLKMIYKIIIYSLLVSAATAIAKGMTTSDGFDLTMLSTIWLVTPTFFTLAEVLMISDVYVLRILNQIVLLIVVYMQFALGQQQYVNLVSTSIVTLALIFGYAEFISEERKIKKAEKDRLKAEEEEHKKTIEAIDKIEPSTEVIEAVNKDTETDETETKVDDSIKETEEVKVNEEETDKTEVDKQETDKTEEVEVDKQETDKTEEVEVDKQETEETTKE